MNRWVGRRKGGRKQGRRRGGRKEGTTTQQPDISRFVVNLTSGKIADLPDVSVSL